MLANIRWRQHKDEAMPEDVLIAGRRRGRETRPTRVYVKGNEGNVVHLSRWIERPKTKRKIERFERETPEEFEKRAARIAELEIELGIF
jgi:5'-3' exonuclease